MDGLGAAIDPKLMSTNLLLARNRSKPYLKFGFVIESISAAMVFTLLIICACVVICDITVIITVLRYTGILSATIIVQLKKGDNTIVLNKPTTILT